MEYWRGELKLARRLLFVIGKKDCVLSRKNNFATTQKNISLLQLELSLFFYLVIIAKPLSQFYFKQNISN